MASLSVSGNIGGHGASVSINMDLGGSHHSHSDSEPRSPPQHPVRPTERAELEDEIKKEVDDQMDQMFAELKEDERLEDDTAMNEVQLMRLKLKYKYKYKYKYEVKKRQDRSTPLLGDSWDLDPALKQSDFGSHSQSAGGAGAREAEEDCDEEEEPEHTFDFTINSDQIDVDCLKETICAGKKVLDTCWQAMAVPPLDSPNMDKKQLREATRENRQVLLPQEKKIKGLLQLLKDLVQITVLAQKEDHGAGGEQSLPTGQTKADPNVGNEKVRKALESLGCHVVDSYSLTKALIKSLMHDLNIKSDDIKEAGEGDSEKPAGWNKSIFVEKKGRHAQAANTKKAGFREFKADPWYRKMSRYG